MSDEQKNVPIKMLHLDLNKPGSLDYLHAMMSEIEMYGGVHETQADRAESKRRLAMIAAGNEVPMCRQENCMEIIVNPLDINDIKLVPLKPSAE